MIEEIIENPTIYNPEMILFFDPNLVDIKLIIPHVVALIMLTTGIGGLIGFSIKKLLHLIKG